METQTIETTQPKNKVYVIMEAKVCPPARQDRREAPASR